MQITHLSFEDARKVQNQVQRISHAVTFNKDESLTCRRPCDSPAGADQFASDIQRILAAVRRKIQIVQKGTENFGPNLLYAVVRFKVIR